MLKYVQARNGIFERHIYDVKPTKWDNENYCLARKLTDEQKIKFGVSKLKIVTPPFFDPNNQKRIELNPNFINGVWTQVYSVVNLTEEEKNKINVEKAILNRQKRNELLIASDWSQLPDSPVNKQAWADYRQALRDIPQQDGFPTEINWPQEPQ